ncbi:uncharacterized protein LOC114245646 [Bombyx mandarina]|uniref:Uncharacterized protein LOC114245646 n=1 Tax=Bombyx mandarina TaxID=7092 RepID=A0A6J2JXX7_BOMMA|nr:uncharacterized protein LOC114245646 [Bombyx mandarina]
MHKGNIETIHIHIKNYKIISDNLGGMNSENNYRKINCTNFEKRHFTKEYGKPTVVYANTAKKKKNNSQSLEIDKYIIDDSHTESSKIINTTTSKENTDNKTISPNSYIESYTLFNEVLNILRNKKNKVDVRKNKDAGTNTDFKIKPILVASKIFSYSIEGSSNKDFTVINSCQPKNKTECAINLLKHKSSSIPQMKIEEIKQNLKENAKSRDSIEEVNRMFARVRNSDYKDENEFGVNRPITRKGPRVLPVVKTNYQNSPDHCKCCQTKHCMSSGDSIKRGRDEKCVYMMCCHYDNSRHTQTGVLFCERCRFVNSKCKLENCQSSNNYN